MYCIWFWAELKRNHDFRQSCSEILNQATKHKDLVFFCDLKVFNFDFETLVFFQRTKIMKWRKAFSSDLFIRKDTWLIRKCAEYRLVKKKSWVWILWFLGVLQDIKILVVYISRKPRYSFEKRREVLSFWGTLMLPNHPN